MKFKAFTLLELLLVILLVALLAAGATLAFRLFRQRTWDATRLADVKQIQNAFELYRRDQNFYPPTIIIGAPLKSPNGRKTYMAKIPGNPSLNGDACTDEYSYKYLNPLAYVFYFCLGSDNGSLVAGQHCATPAGGNRPIDCVVQ